MQNFTSTIKKKEFETMKSEINDMFTIYLDSDAADDTTDRQKKIYAIHCFNQL